MTELATHWSLWASLMIVLAAIGFYLVDRWSMEIVSSGVIAALLLLFALPGATDANGEAVSAFTMLAGFGNPALITIMALLVIGQGLFQTGALEGPSKALLSSFDKHPWQTLVLAFLAVFATSAFINNTPVVIMFLPVMSALAMRMGAQPSKLMMPLSFASIFAGMTTLIGTSTNLLAAEGYERITGNTLGFFEQTPMGLILAGAGFVYLVVASRVLLPNREGVTGNTMTTSGRQFVAQIKINPKHFLFGKSPIAGSFSDLPNVTIRMIQRGEKSILPPYSDITLQAGDILILAATRKTLQTLLERHPDMMEEIWRAAGGDWQDAGGENTLVLTEAVVAPGSRLAGNTVNMMSASHLRQSVALGIQRRSRMIRSQLGDIRLEPGDTLLLAGPSASFRQMRSSRDLILLEWSKTEISLTRNILTARLLTVGMVGLAATGLLSILHASVLTAVAMILLGCLNTRQASRALDLRIYLVIAAALAMGAALEVTGAAELIAQGVVSAAAPYGTLAVLSAIFLAVAILTNLLSNAATAVLFTPIALSAASQLGVTDPLPFLLAVIYGANCCFATPIAYQTNMLVMGPGHYKFRDFLWFGGPLVLLLWAVFTIAAPWRFNL